MRTAGCQSAAGASKKSSISDENEVLAESLDELVESAMSTRGGGGGSLEHARPLSHGPRLPRDRKQRDRVGRR